MTHLVAQLNKSATYFQAPCSTILMFSSFDYENVDNKLQRMNTQDVRN